MNLPSLRASKKVNQVCVPGAAQHEHQKRVSALLSENGALQTRTVPITVFWTVRSALNMTPKSVMCSAPDTQLHLDDFFDRP